MSDSAPTLKPDSEAILRIVRETLDIYGVSPKECQEGADYFREVVRLEQKIFEDRRTQDEDTARVDRAITRLADLSGEIDMAVEELIDAQAGYVPNRAPGSVTLTAEEAKAARFAIGIRAIESPALAEEYAPLLARIESSQENPTSDAKISRRPEGSEAA